MKDYIGIDGGVGASNMMQSVDRLIGKWVKEKKIPGGVLDVRLSGQTVFKKAYGTFSDGENVYPIKESTLFDLASLTKVMATLPAMLLLMADQQIGIDDLVCQYIPQFPYSEITIRQLLNHTSGLSAVLPYKKRHEKQNVLTNILSLPLDYRPGEKAVYSDLGMILAGKIIETVSGDTLDHFCSKHIFEPLQMHDTMFRPPHSLRKRIAATEQVNGAYVWGEVHDEKAFHMGGVSGSAGLFSTASDIQKYANVWLFPEQTHLIPQEYIRMCFTNPVENRGLGWVIWNGFESMPACGESWPLGSFGHTGFTGTSLWMEPKHQLSVVFLTNIVHFGRNNQIHQLRPELHSEIWKSLM